MNTRVSLVDVVFDSVEDTTDHIIICCETLAGLFYFLGPLRMRKVVPNPDQVIVVLLSSVPSITEVDEWSQVVFFQRVYIIQGSPDRRSDLKRAGIDKSSRIILLKSQSKQILATNKPEADVDNILNYLNVINIVKPQKVFVEIIAEDNLRFFLQQNSGSVSPAYASGCVVMSLQEAIMAQNFFNTNTIYLLKLLSHYDIASSHCIAQIALPRSIAQKMENTDVIITFQDLFQKLIANHMLAIGLYRKEGYKLSKMDYVYTCPSPDTIVSIDDKIFIICEKSKLITINKKGHKHHHTHNSKETNNDNKEVHTIECVVEQPSVPHITGSPAQTDTNPENGNPDLFAVQLQLRRQQESIKGLNSRLDQILNILKSKK